jgi:hypothetical protein
MFRHIEMQHLTFAIIPSVHKRLTWSELKANNRDSMATFFLFLFPASSVTTAEPARGSKLQWPELDREQCPFRSG